MLDHSLTDSSNQVVDDFDIGPYHDRILSLGFSTLARRRVISAALFIHSLIIGKLKSPYLRSLLILNTGQKTFRNPEFIKLKTYRTDHTTHSPFNNACRIFNHAALFIEPSLPHIEFRKRGQACLSMETFSFALFFLSDGSIWLHYIILTILHSNDIYEKESANSGCHHIHKINSKK